MTSYERFHLALSQFDPTKWRLFERLASVAVATEYPSIRPLASASGDGGRDAMLFSATDDPGVALQFSVQSDWRSKIRATAKRLRETSPETTLLIFISNQQIGTESGQVVKDMRKTHGLHVDVRDREWLLLNRNAGSAMSAEVEEFCQNTADEYLGSKASIDRQAQALDDLEAKAAFVYLGLQWQDDTREKGLTKVCFEAIVRAILRETSPNALMSRATIQAHASKLLPAQAQDARETQINGALARLTKVQIRHYQKADEFCLTWDERTRLASRLAEVAVQNDALDRELATMTERLSEDQGLNLKSAEIAGVVSRARSVLERVLLNRGATFAEAVLTERGASIRFEDIEAVVYTDLLRPESRRSPVDPRQMSSIVSALLIEPPVAVQAYLRNLADTYTLFAFMKETPDVQSAIVKIFADGDIWLDTSVVLPALGEELLPDHARSHSILLRATHEAGLRLYVTDGVIQELTTHITRSRRYVTSGTRDASQWSEPFLVSCFRLSGRPIIGFDSWSETFCGSARSEDDVADYLREFHHIEVRNLHEQTENADPVLRAMVAEIWHEARDERDRRANAVGAAAMDPGTRSALVAHDVENYVGTIQRRIERRERNSAFGFKTWWLTLDGTAFRASRALEGKIEGKPPASPAISPDFMLRYLSVGPIRSRLSRKTEEVLPLMLNMSILDAVPPELLELSDTLRRELIGLPSHVVRRKIRDALDEARLLLGARARAGQSGLSDEIKARLLETARSN